MVQDFGPHTITGTLRTYNRGLSIATRAYREKDQNQQWQWQLESGLPTQPVTTVAKAIADTVSTHLASATQQSAEGMNHMVEPPDYSGQSLIPRGVINPAKTGLAKELGLATVFMPCTHGALDGFWSPIGHPGIPNEKCAWQWVGDRVSLGRAVPPFNLVIMYACTVGIGTTGAARFGVIGRVDAGYAGFVHEVDENLYPVPTSGTLDLYAAKVMEQLKLGKTLEDAAAAAYAIYRPLDRQTGQPANLVIAQGCDPLTSLVHFYMSAEERITYHPLVPTTWFWSRPVQTSGT